jgi:hypothetical protein
MWGLLLVPYRLLRRGARKRKAEMMRHREMMGTIQGSAAGSAAAIVTATTRQLSAPQTATETAPIYSPTERIGDSDRERAIEELHEHLLAGRLSAAEFEGRVDSVQNAATRGDLDAALADLPSSPGAPARAPFGRPGDG